MGKIYNSFERLHKWREFQKEWPNVKPAATPTVALVGPVSYIYIFSNVETGRFKIGKANNVANRFKTAQTFASERLERVCERSVPASKVYDIEKKIHKALKHHRRNGEWFSCPKEVAIETMDFDYRQHIVIVCVSPASGQARASTLLTHSSSR